MLQHGTPWQAALGAAFVSTVIFIVSMILSLISGYFNWYSILTAFFLIAGFYVIISIIPLLLNLSRSYFSFVCILLIVHILVTILSFALHYKVGGLVGMSGYFIPTLTDALYFSVTTFTTLGYGDFRPIVEQRLTTSIEALAGMMSMAIGASLIWLWCQENMVPKEKAFFDGNRRHKGSLSVTRIRVKTLTGKERNLKSWVLPPRKGESFYYDDDRQEWVQVTEDTVLPENALVLGHKETDKNA
ncbi:potassium channel protein [candidate division WS5 bacterium]|uniref:Potassium channel protein n=1 Tax=candidate division WS5 bacterium TaxID=2093353 RepID=A0A419D9H9_9BACT|nr:MAG: potassium channel protein [candidate division WS5 bacterium]